MKTTVVQNTFMYSIIMTFVLLMLEMCIPPQIFSATCEHVTIILGGMCRVVDEFTKSWPLWTDIQLWSTLNWFRSTVA